MGYAARYLNNSNLEKLIFVSKPSSAFQLISSGNNFLDLKILHIVLLILGLLSLPTFTTIFTLCAYLDQVNQSTLENRNPINNTVTITFEGDLKYLVGSILVMCFLSSAGMVILQVINFAIAKEWFYCVPYLWLMILILVSNIAFAMMANKTDKENRITKSSVLVEAVLLGIFTTTIQFLSWHLVFVFYGFILSPLRALLCSAAIIITVICSIILMTVIFKVLNAAIEAVKVKLLHKCISRYQDISADTDGKNIMSKIILMFALVMLLTFTYTYCVFILHVSINNSDQAVVNLIESLIPKAFLILIAWFLYNMIVNLEKTKKFWLLLKMFMNPLEMSIKATETINA